MAAKDDQPGVEAPAEMITLDLSKYETLYHFVPDSTIGKMQIIEQTWGALEIRIGNSFQLSITEDPGDLELRKTDIKGDEVNRFKSFIVEEEGTIMWESEITKPEFHFTAFKSWVTQLMCLKILKAPKQSLFRESVQTMLDSAKGLKK